MIELHWMDLAVIICFFLCIFAIAAYYSPRAGKGTKEFFLSGRDMPWYLAGTAMVATTFAADTPLAVTELVARNGIAGNWLWWNMAIGGMLTVFFFARLWRRAEILTDVEFTELRYSGKAAAVLRGFRAVYLGLFMNAIVLSWVHKAMEKIFRVTIPQFDPFLLVTVAAIIIAIYASASGLLGTARTDSFQFVFAMTGCIILAIIVIQIPEIGGATQLKGRLPALSLDFLPKIGTIGIEGAAGGVLSLSVGAFFAHIGLQWWSSWYPGADPGGGGYVAQRMMSAKDEKHSLFATLWFMIAHYALRPWPWILVALCALLILPRSQNPDMLKQENPALFAQVETVYPIDHTSYSQQTESFKSFYEKYENTVDPGIMYPKLMVRYLPVGLLGLLIAVFLAAYMSTIASQLNWGTSYIINDVYKRFIKADASERHYVFISRIGIIIMTLLSLLIARYLLTTISGAWEFIINASAGMGAVLILRWFWWRINAWSEISAMIAPLIIYPVARFYFGMESPITLYPIVLGTTVVWLLVTFLTRPVSKDKLVAFYKKTYPGGIGWKIIAKECPEIKERKNFNVLLRDWLLSVIMVYAFLFGIGKLIFADYFSAGLLLAMACAGGYVIYHDFKKL
jgi:SSS family solute:Na+ symporter